jgi:hypothetical protein
LGRAERRNQEKMSNDKLGHTANMAWEGASDGWIPTESELTGVDAQATTSLKVSPTVSSSRCAPAYPTRWTGRCIVFSPSALNDNRILR